MLHSHQSQPRVITTVIAGLVIRSTNPLILRKTPYEKILIREFKKEENSRIRSIFGTKRVGNAKFTRHAKLSII